MSTSNLNKIDARMQQKHDIAANWKESDFIPEAGEYIIYDPDEYTSFPRIKIGDGIHTANELFFVSEVYTDTEEPQDAEDGAIWFNPEDYPENIFQDLIDTTLSIEGKAAEAKAVGTSIAALTQELNDKIGAIEQIIDAINGEIPV